MCISQNCHNKVAQAEWPGQQECLVLCSEGWASKIKALFGIEVPLLSEWSGDPEVVNV